MSYWIEVRCARMKAGGCFSARQVDTPMGLTHNSSRAAVQQTLRRLTAQATAFGWRNTKHGWICPSCQ